MKKKITFVIGSSGVGKTSVMGCLACRHIKKHKEKVGFIYGNVIEMVVRFELSISEELKNSPFQVVAQEDNFSDKLNQIEECGMVYVDTPSILAKDGRKKILKWMEAVPEEWQKEIYLVLPATMKFNDMKHIVKLCRKFKFDFKMVFSMLDETQGTKNIIRIIEYAGVSAPYVKVSPKVMKGFRKLDMDKIFEKA